MHDLRPSGVDQRAVFGQLCQERLIDGVLGLVRQWHMQRYILALEERLHGVCRRRAHLGDHLLGDVRVVRDGLHAECLGQLVHRPRHCAKSIEGNLAAHKLKSAGAIEVVPGTGEHHTKDKLRHRVGVLSRCVHSHNLLGAQGRQVKIVDTGTRTHHDLQLVRFIHYGLVHNVTANDQCVHAHNSGMKVLDRLIVLKLLQCVTCILEDGLDLGHSLGCKSLLGGKQRRARTAGAGWRVKRCALLHRLPLLQKDGVWWLLAFWGIFQLAPLLKKDIVRRLHGHLPNWGRGL
mmetsp:Transcript_144898/g.263444  ORF Transcript_144898/g.263444 Transcript_144898/m.263444 type:complete len:290 (-) Transcript_144898:48-917(-)